jgi:hypothetical protein
VKENVSKLEPREKITKFSLTSLRFRKFSAIKKGEKSDRMDIKKMFQGQGHSKSEAPARQPQTSEDDE